MVDQNKAEAIIKKAQEDYSSGKISRRDFNSVMMTFGAIAGYTLFNSFASAWTGTRMRKTSAGDVGHQIQRSLRFRSSASAFISRTPTSASNRQTSTLNLWFKRGQLGVQQRLFTARASTTDDTTLFALFISASDKLTISGSLTVFRVSTSVFRDPSAWYCLTMVIDTTNATSQNRIRVYINNVEITVWDTNNSVPLNLQTAVNNNVGHWLMSENGSATFFDGYLSEVNFIDGLALTPSSFGKLHTATGVWGPIKYAGGYGTNGFYLPFTDTSSTTNLVKDSSGNNNHWTANNISLTAGITYDSMTDVPLNYGTSDRGNYCTWNPLVTASDATLSNANLTVSYGSSSTIGMTVGTIGQSSGKWYYEFVCTATTVYTNPALLVGVVKDNFVQANYPGQNSSGWGQHPYDGNKYHNGTAAAYGTAGVVNDIYMCAYDIDDGKIWWGKNGSWFASGDPAAGTNAAYTNLAGNTIFPAIGDGGGASTFSGSANFGQRPFSYTPPTGFKALHTGNLPTPTIIKSNQYFDITSYAGDSAASRVFTNSGMQPDLVWLKARNAVDGNLLVDSVRGVNKNIKTDTNTAETTGSTVTSFNSNGFTGDLNVNVSGRNYIAWQWKKGITPGLDIVTYTGDGNNSRQIPHSLGVTPAFYMTKNRNGYNNSNGFNDWNTFHKSTGTLTTYMMSTIAAGGAGGFSGGLPTSTYFYPNMQLYDNVSGQTYVAYVFAEINGFSKFGTYTGTGSTDGAFAYCGFRPKWIMIKNITNAQGWIIIDTSRNTYNVAGDYLFADSANGENSLSSRTTATDLDILSNGFKLRNNAGSSGYTNASANNYIFIAFAEAPFKYANAR